MLKRKELLWQLYLSYIVIIVISLGAVSWYSSKTIKGYYYENISSDLKALTVALDKTLPPDISLENSVEVDRICKEIGKSIERRITVILPSGKVVGDTVENPDLMDNHSDRPEIMAAYRESTGRSTRFSYTLQEDLMYVASPITREGTTVAVVRASVPITDINEKLSSMYKKITLAGFMVALLASFISLLIAHRIRKPMREVIEGANKFASGNLQYRLPQHPSKEIGGLSDALNKMAQDLDSRIKTITQQKNELEAVLKSMIEAVIVMDTNEKILRCNEAAGLLFGIDPCGAKGKSLQETVRNPKLHEFVKETLKNTAPTEQALEIHDPVEKFLQATGTILKDAEGNSIGALIVLNDITRLQKLENVRKDFVSNVSHELKTPITSIKGFVETLREGAHKDPKAKKRFLDIIASHSDRLNAIIEDLLSLSRIEQMEGKQALELEEVKIRKTLNSAVSLCQISAKDKNISIELDCPEDLKAHINPPFMENAVTNLLQNAVKYSENDKTVSIKAKRHNGNVIIDIKDQGPGIGTEHLSRIFERFYRVDKARSRKMGGTGLGLAIVKHIVKAHGGDITVKSKHGSGSTFSIILPA